MLSQRTSLHRNEDRKEDKPNEVKVLNPSQRWFCSLHCSGLPICYFEVFIRVEEDEALPALRGAMGGRAYMRGHGRQAVCNQKDHVREDW